VIGVEQPVVMVQFAEGDSAAHRSNLPALGRAA
jgi:hypothetical protein